jgi:hypothetical protein
LLLSANISDLAINQAFPAILVVPTLAGLLVWGLQRLFKDSHRAAFVAFLGIFWFFFYGTVRIVAGVVNLGGIALNQHTIFFTLWSLAFLLMGSSWIWRRVQSPQTITDFLNLVCTLVFVISVGRIALDLAPRYLNQPDASALIAGLPEQQREEQPDIYYIIVDGYARSDLLQEIFGYDNTAFLQALESRGFYVAGQSQSNYMQTALSLASSMNLDYLTGLPTAMPDRGQLIGMIRHSKLRETLEYLGYQIVTFDSGYQPTTLSDTDHYLASDQIKKNRDLEAYLWINSVAVILIENHWVEAPITRYSAQQARVLYTFDQLAPGTSAARPKVCLRPHHCSPPAFHFRPEWANHARKYYILSDGNRWVDRLVAPAISSLISASLIRQLEPAASD